jgi:Ca2+-binding RTX toxin-like protein
VYDLRLSDVFVNHITDSGGTDHLEFTYRKVSLTTREQNATGNFVAENTFGWDVGLNRSDSHALPIATAGNEGGTANVQDFYLTINGLDGGSGVRGHENAFAVADFKFDISNEILITKGGAFDITTKTFAPLLVDLIEGSKLNAILSAAGSSSLQGIKSIRLEGVAEDGQTVYDLRLANVMVSRVTDGDGVDHLEFNYNKVSLTTRKQNPDGSLGAEQTVSWDVAKNTAITTPLPVAAASSNATHSSETTVNIGVTAANDNPVIINNNGNDLVISFLENEIIPITTILASDIDNTADQFSYSLSGADAALFNISNSGVLSFNASPNFEAPIDAGFNNTYEVAVRVNDGAGGNDTQNVLITVTDANETIPVDNGTTSDDSLNGTPKDDNLNGLGGNDTLNGGLGSDTLNGGIGNDTINGGAGNDVILVTPGGGTDAVNGGTGIDRIEATANNTNIGLNAIENIENISANGFNGVQIAGSNAPNSLDFSRVTLTGIKSIKGKGGNDNITGSDTDDKINGGAGNDTLNGNAGNDTLLGGTGKDRLTGGTGDDFLNGGKGNDLFVFNALGFGNDTIGGGGSSKFDALGGTASTQDRIDLRGLGLTFDALQHGIAQTGANTVITIGNDHITLVGINTAQIDATDFVF